MSGRLNTSSSASDKDEKLRRTSRRRTGLQAMEDSQGQDTRSPSPPLTRSRTKYARKPIYQYGSESTSTATSKSPSKPKFDQEASSDDYTRILKPLQDEVDHNVASRSLEHEKYSSPTNYDGRKISEFVQPQEKILENALSPPIGVCKTSSPMFAVRNGDLPSPPTSAIAGPSNRFFEYRSTNSHEESYISTTRTSNLSRNRKNTTPAVELSENEPTPKIGLEKRNITSSSSSVEHDTKLSVARDHHERLRRRQMEKEEQRKQEWNATWMNSFGIFVCSAIVLSIAISFVFVNGSQPLSETLKFLKWRKQYNHTMSKNAGEIKDLLRQLKARFPSQSDDTWKVVHSNVQRIARDSSNQAACIVFVRPTNSSKIDHNTKGTEECMASAIAEVISQIHKEILKEHYMKGHTTLTFNSQSDVTIDSNKFRHDKSGLHTAVEYSLSQYSAVALLDINELDGRTAMALHSFCDSDATDGEDPNMAPYVHTAVLTTLKVENDGFTEQQIKQGGLNKLAHSLAQRELTTAWKSDIGEDKAASLISRVALNAVFLNTESSQDTKDFCLQY